MARSIKEDLTFIAEVSCNHEGRLDNALKLCDEAKRAGADYVKFQAYTPDTITFNGSRTEFTIEDGPWTGRSLYELYIEAHTPRHWFRHIDEHCHDIDIKWAASVFSVDDANFIRGFRPDFYKIASFEAMDVGLIEHVSAFGDPMMISNGVMGMDNFNASMRLAKERSVSVTPMVCTSDYPASGFVASEMTELLIMHGKVGLSDHTLNSVSAIQSVTIGARFFEKHLMLDGCAGLDAGHSVTGEGMTLYIKDVVEAYGNMKNLRDNRGKSLKAAKFGRSLYVVEDVEEGEKFTRHNVRSIRPGYGLSCMLYDKVIMFGRAEYSIKAGEPLTIKNCKF